MIEMQHSEDRLRLEVRDRSPKAPVIGVGGPRDCGGRGLRIVDAVSEAWGWEPTADGNVFGRSFTPRSIVPAALTASRSRPPPDTPAGAR